MTPTPAAITKSTRVELGILITLVGTVAAGAVYCANLNSHVVVAIEEMKTMRRAIEAHTTQLSEIGRAVAVLETIVESDRKRIDRLEHK